MLPRLLAVAAVLSISACSDTLTAPSVEITSIGPLKLVVSDQPSSGGIDFALPFVADSTGAIIVGDTQYGSLCQTAVTGSASVNGTAVVLRVTFAERMTVCTQEIRALSYHATITVPAGPHDVTVIHYEYNGKPDTLVQRSVATR